MQIQMMPSRGDATRQWTVDQTGARLLSGGNGFAVQVGDRLVGFSGERVARVALEFRDGGLHIQLMEQGGQPLREYRVPGFAAVSDYSAQLRDAGIVFSAQEKEPLVNLMKLSLAGGMDRSSLVMLLDEIRFITIQAQGPETIDTGQLHQALNQRVGELLKAMPEEIQTYVILTNKPDFPEEVWRALWFLSKFDPATDPLLSKFLSGSMAMNDRLLASLREIAARTNLRPPAPFPAMDADAFRALVKALGELRISGNPSVFHIPTGLARFIFDHMSPSVPDFAAAPTFDALLAKLVQTHAGKIEPGTGREPDLARVFQTLLDTGKYSELAAFLAGKKDSRFSLEVRESLLHFLKSASPQDGGPRLSSVDPAALDRILAFLDQAKHAGARNRLQALIADLGPQGTQAPSISALDFLAMPERIKLAAFTLEHLDPLRHGHLYNFFRGGHQLANMTPSLSSDLAALLEKGHFPKVQGGLDRVGQSQFNALVHWFEKQGHSLRVPLGFLPRNPAVAEMLQPWQGSHQTEKGGMAATRADSPPGAEQFRELARRLDGLDPAAQDRLLTDSLRKWLPNFSKLALLDQTWKVQRLTQALALDTSSMLEIGREIAAALRTIGTLLRGAEGESPQWDLWRQAREAIPPNEPKPTLKQRLLQEQSGLQRYAQLAAALPSEDKGLEAVVGRLSWLRRLDRLTQAVDQHRGEHASRLLEVLAKGDKLLEELIRFATHDPQAQWQRFSQSPLTKRKQNAFEAFRQQLLEGQKPDPTPLFKGPFLRASFGEKAERRHREEMSRLEPLFREALTRSADPRGLAAQMQTMLRGADGAPDMAGRLREMVELIRDLNQFQNLNEEPLYLSLPMEMGGKQCQFELAYRRLPGKKGSNRRFLVVLHLDFPQWGHLRVDALREAERLSATFWVENPAMHHALLKDLHLLEDRLEEGGLGETQVTVKINPARASASVAALCAAPDEGQLDMKI